MANMFDIGSEGADAYNFTSNDSFNQDISSWDVSGVTTTREMFYASPFNQNISSWDVSSVTTMKSMFYNASAFSQDITVWTTNTTEFDSTNYANMFNNADAWLVDYAYTVKSDVCSERAPFGPAECWSVSVIPEALTDGNSTTVGTMFWAISTWCDIGPVEWDLSYGQTYGSIEGWNITFVTDMSSLVFKYCGREGENGRVAYK